MSFSQSNLLCIIGSNISLIMIVLGEVGKHAQALQLKHKCIFAIRSLLSDFSAIFAGHCSLSKLAPNGDASDSIN